MIVTCYFNTSNLENETVYATSLSVLDSGLSCLGSRPVDDHCVVFLGKTLYSHSAPLHPGVYMGTGEFTAGGGGGGGGGGGWE